MMQFFEPKPKEIWIFDDTLIKGTHFLAIKSFFNKEFPGIPVVGFFIARSIVKNNMSDISDTSLG